MSETNPNTTEAALSQTQAPIKTKMSIEDTVKMLQNYLGQADNSIAQLQTNIDSASNQVNEWKKLQLMIVGQKQLITDLLNKVVEMPPPELTEAPKDTEPKETK